MHVTIIMLGIILRDDIKLAEKQEAHWLPLIEKVDAQERECRSIWFKGT